MKKIILTLLYPLAFILDKFPLIRFRVKDKPDRDWDSMTFFPFVIIVNRSIEKYDVNSRRAIYNHEKIHIAQMIDWILLAITLWALGFSKIVWIPLLFGAGIFNFVVERAVLNRTYSQTATERECFDNEYDPMYLYKRIPFAYIFK